MTDRIIHAPTVSRPDSELAARLAGVIAHAVLSSFTEESEPTPAPPPELAPQSPPATPAPTVK